MVPAQMEDHLVDEDVAGMTPYFIAYTLNQEVWQENKLPGRYYSSHTIDVAEENVDWVYDQMQLLQLNTTSKAQLWPMNKYKPTGTGVVKLLHKLGYMDTANIFPHLETQTIEYKKYPQTAQFIIPGTEKKKSTPPVNWENKILKRKKDEFLQFQQILKDFDTENDVKVSKEETLASVEKRFSGKIPDWWKVGARHIMEDADADADVNEDRELSHEDFKELISQVDSTITDDAIHAMREWGKKLSNAGKMILSSYSFHLLSTDDRKMLKKFIKWLFAPFAKREDSSSKSLY